MDKLIKVNEASNLVTKTVTSFGVEEVPLEQSLGRILMEEAIADRDFPPYDRVTMDGIAILFDRYKNGQRSFAIQGLCAAGTPQQTLFRGDSCLEVMTGSIMPKGVDTVIRYEDISISEGMAAINIETIIQGKNIHQQGSDQVKGSLVLAKDKCIGPAEIAIAASIGKKNLLVRKHPKAIVISTGDELVDIEQVPMPHQIRTSNVHTIQACLQSWGVKSDRIHLNDDKETILDHLKDILINYELVILSGGVSKGKLDFIPQALDDLGVQKLFHGVRQRPGKPFWFGKKERAVVFALPGNPVSSFMCTLKYVKAWVDESLSKNNQTSHARLEEDVLFKPDLTYFLPVSIKASPSGFLLAKSEKGNGSGDLVGLSNADGFLELPAGKNEYKAGEIFSFLPFSGSMFFQQ